MPLAKNQCVTVDIESISSDGAGVARLDGLVLFIPGTAVGDRVNATIVKLAKTHGFGRLQQVVTPGPGRQKEDCPISRQCGGCSFRHLTYPAELAAKQGFVADAMRRIGHFDLELLPILPSPQNSRYRNKVQYPVADVNGQLTFGFYASRSHRVVPCSDCLLQPELLNRIAARAVQLLQQGGATAYNEADGTGLVRHVALRQGFHSGQVLLCLVATRAALPGEEALVAQLLAEYPEITSIVVNENPLDTNVIYGKTSRVLHGSGSIDDTLLGVPMKLNQHTFAQVNSAAAENLFTLAAQLAAPTLQDTLLDLYCGTGVIGLSMAQRVGRLVGVEIVPEAVESARASALEMGAKNAEFFCEDAGKTAARLSAEGLRPSIVVLDPPRKGADAATLDAILKMAPGRIVMISCNPATAARDLALLAAGGYRLCSVQPADLFPRTKHVECIALLEKQA